MTLLLLIEQCLNGLQMGVALFLMAAGLTLIFGVMGVINLAHGSLFMVGAFAAAGVAAALSGSEEGMDGDAPPSCDHGALDEAPPLQTVQ